MPEDKINLLLPDAQVNYWPHYFTNHQSSYFKQQLLQTTQWQQESIKIFGKETPLPRLTAWYGDAGKTYSYSGIKNNPLPWTPVLLQIKQAIETEVNIYFNSVLLNYYRHGQDSMGWHTDNEPELGINPVIASVSFGQERRFSFRHRHQKNIPNHTILLKNGSLLLMQGATQHNWQHQLPKTSKPATERINLTFRVIK